MPWQPSISLIASILSDEVYHNTTDQVTPPSGWKLIQNTYDPTTGYYGEAWGDFSSGATNPSTVIIVNRGTTLAGPTGIAPVTFPADELANGAASNIFSDNPNGLANTANADTSLTVGADAAIVLGGTPGYLAAGQAFAQSVVNNVANQYGTGTQVDLAGQSLGGATTDYEAQHLTLPAGMDPVQGFAYNPLPWLSYGSLNGNTVTNYYVGNEFLTQNFLLDLTQTADSFLAPQVGSNVYLPSLNIPGGTPLGDIFSLHFPDADVSAMVLQDFQNESPADQQAEIALLTAAYPNASARPADINAIIQGQAPTLNANDPGLSIAANGNISIYGDIVLSGGAVGQVFGSVFGHLLDGNNEFVNLAANTAFSAIGTDLGTNFTIWANSANPDFSQTIAGVTSQFLGDVGTAALGTVGGFLGGELVDALGIKSLAGQVASDAAGSIITQIATNISNHLTGSAIFNNVGAGLPSALGSFFGSELGSLVVSPTTLGGQIGSQLGSGLGGLAGLSLADSGFVDVPEAILSDAIGGALDGATIGDFVFPVIGAFIGFVVGTLLGDLFGSTPSPQAYVNLSAVAGGADGATFVSFFRSSKDSGPVSQVMSLGSVITQELNGVIAATGGKLTNIGILPAIVVGIRRGTPELIGPNGDEKFSGPNGIDQMVATAVFTELQYVQIVGGDPFVKRAIEAAGASAFSGSTLISDLPTLAGDIQVAKDYERYLANPTVVNAEMTAQPNTAFAATWETELAQAADLGLDKRGLNDWNAGWNGFLKAQNVDPLQVTFSYSGNERLITAGGTVVDDTIDSTDKTIIQGDNSTGQTITVLDNVLQLPNTGTLTANGTPVTAPVTIPIAAMIYGGNGAGDVIWAGNEGNDVFGGNGGTTAAHDTIYGYSSPTDKVAAATWMYGGSGTNVIIAGVSSGDYLKGGAGNDTIDAALTDSAWIDGGTGNNNLIGGEGDDVITAEGGSSTALYNDTMIGGGGNDTYIVNPYSNDTINNAPASGQAPGGGTIELGDNVAFSQVGMSTVSGSGANTNLVIKIYAATSGGGGTVPGGYTQVDASNTVIETITVQNWSVLADRVQYLQSFDPQTGTSQSIDIGNFSNIVVGTPGNDFLEGSQGSDGIFGMGGTDTIEGFGSNDLINGDGFLDGGTGNDTIFGGSQADTLLGGPGSNVLEGAGGNDLILGAAFDTVAADSNTIQGGPGNDTVIGGPDHNLFEYAAGDGSDLLISSLNKAISTSTTSTTGTVSFTAGWIPVWLSSSKFQSDFARNAASGEITLTNPTVVDGQTLSAGTPIYYTQQTTVGGAVIPAGTMNGIVDVEDGISTLTGISDSGIYWQPFINQSTMTQTVSNANDTLQFGPSVTPSELLFLHPAGSNDLLIGINDGNTNAAAAPGSFTELSDQIRIENYFTTGAIGEISFESATGSIIPVNLATTALLGPSVDGGAQLVSVSNTASTQAYWITGAAPNDTLASGAGDTLIGGAGNDTIYGGAGNNRLIGNAGNDSLVAGSTGVDTLDGGPGADTLVGDGQTWASYADASAGVTANLGDPTGDTVHAASNLARTPWLGARYTDVAGFLFYLDAYETSFWRQPASHMAAAATYANSGDAAGDIYTNITGFIGSKYNDTLVATATGSSLDGGGGNDLLVGGAGNDDFVYNVAPTGALAYGSDTIQLGGGSDTLDINDTGGTGVTFDNLVFSSANGTLVITDGPSHTISVLGLTSAGQTLTINLDGDTSVTFSGLPVSGNSGFAAAMAVGATVDGGAAATVIVGSAGNDRLVGASGNDTFEGGPGADTIVGAGAAGTADNTASYAGSSAGVSITLNNGAATGVGGDAQGDILTDIQNLVGSAHNDSLTGDANSNLIDGGTGNDTISGGGGNDTLIGDGVDSIVSGTGNALISVANCTLTGAGSTLIGGAGNNTIYGGAGNDYITSTAGFASSLNGGAGNDTLIGNGNDTLDGGGGNDLLEAGSGNAYLEDSNSNATLDGGSGQDTLFGGAGNNVLNAAATANTVLISDEGSLGGTLMSGAVSAADTNTLNGSTMAGIGAGNDTFEFSATSGISIVKAENGVNELQFDSSVNYQDLWFKGSSPVLDIFLVGSSQPFEVEIPNFFYPGNNYAPSIADIVADGKVLFLSQFNATATPTQSLMYEQANLWGSSGAPSSVPGALTNLLNEGYYWQPIATATDTLSGAGGPALLRGTPYNNVITGKDTVAGTSDTIIAGGGTNLITEAGNTGASIIGGSDSDTLIGGPGPNTILGGSGAESITGGASADLITAGSGAETINGLDGNDTITGGNGNYWIAGGGGSDLISVGSGNDTIYGYEPSSAPGSGSDTDGANTIIAGGGNDLIYAGQDATLSGGDSIQLGASATPGNTTIYGGTGWDTINLNGASAASDNLVFATGKDIIYQGEASDSITGQGTDTVWFDSVSSGVTINMQTGVFAGGAAGDQLSGIDNIWGSGYADSIQANNDAEFSIRGAGGGDTLVAGSGNDVLQDTGNATMTGGAGNDSFIVFGGTDVLTGGSGDDDFFLYDSLGGTLSQGTRTANGKQDVIDLEVGSTGTLTVNGPGIMPPATEVSTEIAYLDNTPYYDLWFSTAQGSNNLTITELNSTGTQTLLDLVGWFTNPAIQDALNLQFFDAGTPMAGLSQPAGNVVLTSSSTEGLDISALLQLEATVAAPTNSVQANALYTGAYKTALDLDWSLNTPPTIAIQGSNTGTVLENINSGTTSSTLSFTVSVGDSQTVAPNLVISASGGTLAAASWTQPNSAGIATITVTASQFVYGDIPIGVTVTDGDGAHTSTTYTLDVLPVDPPPVFVNGGVTGVSFNEGPTVTTKGTLIPSVTFYVDDLTPSGADDAGAVLVTASSSNQALISNADIGISTVAGYPTERVLTMNAEANHYGSSWITLTANDGSVSTTETFLATVNKVEIPPVISNVGTQTYEEADVNEYQYIGFYVTGANGITPSVSDAVGANSWWIQTNAAGDGITYEGNNYYVATITVDAGSWTTGYPGTSGGWTGSVVITASDGTDAPQEAIPISSVWEHLPFTLPTSQTFTVNENSGLSVLTGMGAVGPIGNGNSDTYTYTVLSGGNTDNGAIVVASATGVVYDNGISWSPNGGNSYEFWVQVSNGGFADNDLVTVNVLDNSPPTEYLSIVQQHSQTLPKGPTVQDIDEVYIEAIDPHGLSCSFTITSQTHNNNYTYTLEGTSSASGTSYSAINLFIDSNETTPKQDTLVITATNTQGLSNTQTITVLPVPIPGYSVGHDSSSSTHALATGYASVPLHAQTATASDNGSVENLVSAMAAFGNSQPFNEAYASAVWVESHPSSQTLLAKHH